MLLKSKESKVVFAAFMQHCIQSTVMLLNLLLMSKGLKVSNTLYTGPLAPPRGKAIYLKAFCLVALAVHHQSVWGGSFVNFLGLVKLQGWLQARCRANPQFLKLKGTQQPPVILTYLQKSCILHTLNKLPAQCNFDPKSVFNAWRMWACIIPLELAGSVLCKVGSHEQVD